jgi:hypothetical protein
MGLFMWSGLGSGAVWWGICLLGAISVRAMFFANLSLGQVSAVVVILILLVITYQVFTNKTEERNVSWIYAFL